MIPLAGIAVKAAVAGSVAMAPIPVHSHDVVVKTGDTLSALALSNRVPGGWPSLYAANQKIIGQNPDLIIPGQKFVIPPEAIKTSAAIRPESYTVRSNDTLTSIAAKFKTPGGWESIFADNTSLADPNVLAVGMMLNLPDHAMFRAYVPPVAPAPAPAPVTSAPSAPVKTVTTSASSARRSYTSNRYIAPRSAAPVASATYHGSSGMQQCIIARESGGNAQVMNATGHYGLYQFSEATWVASGGSAATFGHASVAEQNQVFANAVAARGYSDWAAYDGC